MAAVSSDCFVYDERRRSKGIVVELDQLQHFLRVAELGSMTRAAVASGLSQPAVSRAIARLE